MTNSLPPSSFHRIAKMRVIIFLSLALWLVDNIFLGGYYIAPGTAVLGLAACFYLIKRYQRQGKSLPRFLEWIMRLIVEEQKKVPLSEQAAKE